MVAVILSGVVLLLAMHGVHVTALQVTRRRWREVAIRRAVGAGRGMDALGPLPYVVIGGGLVVLAVASSTAAVRAALGVEPAAVVA